MKLAVLIITLFGATMSYAQVKPAIEPPENSQRCPEETNGVLLTFNFGTTSSSNFTIDPGTTLRGVSIITNIYGTQSPSIGNAQVKFHDTKGPHQFRVNNYNGGYYTYTYSRIQTLDGIKPKKSQVPPMITPSYDDELFGMGSTSIPPCSNTPLPYIPPTVHYVDAVSKVQFGDEMNNYEWLLPKGWKIGNQTSDGVTAILLPRSSSVLITPATLVFNDAEIKVRALNNCVQTPQLKKSEWFRIHVFMQTMRLYSPSGQNIGGTYMVPVNCGEVAKRTFAIDKVSEFHNCISGTYTWNLGPVPNGWTNENGVDMGETVTTQVPYLEVWTKGTNTSAQKISVTVNDINGVPFTTSIPLKYNDCSSAPFALYSDVSEFECNKQTTATFQLVNQQSIPNGTSLTWNLGPQPNGWLYNGSPAPSTITTFWPVKTLTLTSTGTQPPASPTVTVNLGGNIATYILSQPLSYNDCPCKPLAAMPTGFTVSNITENSAFLSWDAQQDVSFYASIYGGGPGGFSTSSNSYSLTGLLPNTNYSVYLNAFNCRGVNGATVIQFTTPPATCPTPTNLVATNVPSGLSFTWNPVPNAMYYILSYTDPVSNTTYSNSVSTQPYIWYNVTTGNSYTFTIQAKCYSGTYTVYSQPSAPFSITRCLPSNPPYAQPSGSNLYLYFSNLQPGTASYNLKYKAYGSTVENIIYNIPITSPYPFRGVPGVPYQFALQSNCSNSSVSQFSAYTITPAAHYRVRQDDTLISKENDATEIRLYPNPASDKLLVTFSHDADEPVRYHIIDVLGRTVTRGIFQARKGQNSPEISVRNLGDGLHVFELIRNDKKQQKKFIVGM